MVYRYLKIILLGIVIVLAGLFLSTSFWLPDYLNKKIGTILLQSCPKCQFHVAHAYVSFLTGQVFFDKISFASDPDGGTVVDVALGALTADFDVQELMKRQLFIKKLKLTDLVVHVEEKHDPHPPPPDPTEILEIEASYGGKIFEGLPEAEIKNIILENARLEYVLRIFGKKAPILISEINADISDLATRKDKAPRFTEVNLKGRIEESGTLNFKCRADLFSVKNEDQIEIEIKNQKMAEFNPFFTVEDGIEMAGEIDEAQASLYLTKGYLSGQLQARYHDLEMHFMSTPDASPLKVFFENILQKFKIVKTKPKEKEPLPEAPVSYSRHPGQGLINLILQGLKEAALKVVSH